VVIISNLVKNKLFLYKKFRAGQLKLKKKQKNKNINIFIFIK